MYVPRSIAPGAEEEESQGKGEQAAGQQTQARRRRRRRRRRFCQVPRDRSVQEPALPTHVAPELAQDGGELVEFHRIALLLRYFLDTWSLDETMFRWLHSPAPPSLPPPSVSLHPSRRDSRRLFCYPALRMLSPSAFRHLARPFFPGAAGGIDCFGGGGGRKEERWRHEAVQQARAGEKTQVQGHGGVLRRSAGGEGGHEQSYGASGSWDPVQPQPSVMMLQKACDATPLTIGSTSPLSAVLLVLSCLVLCGLTNATQHVASRHG